MSRWAFVHRWSSPRWFYQLSGKVLPYLWLICIPALCYGLLGGLVYAPADFQQGDSFRIMYIHVPAAFLSLSGYLGLAIVSAVYLIWKIKLADVVAQVMAPIGAWFTALALVTGAIWGKPTWGTWWIWDARLTSELILLFLFLGYIGLRQAILDRHIAARAAAILALVGVVNVPIIHYSVVWWNTLHQGASLSLMSKPTIANSMLYPLLAMLLGFYCFFAIVVVLRTRVAVLQSEAQSSWAQEELLS